MQLIKIHTSDNVAVALEDIPKGAEVTVDGKKILANEEIRRGHKIALTAMQAVRMLLNTAIPLLRLQPILQRVTGFILTT